MTNKLYLSMGSLVERRNNFDDSEVARTVPALMEEGFIDGAEFMFIKAYYRRAEELARKLVSEGCRFPTFHTDKDIGAVLSNAGVSFRDGWREEAARLRKMALEMFEYNCLTAVEAGSERLVLHLWGGQNSDTEIGYNVDALPRLEEIAERYGLRIMVENVPSVDTDPLTNWKKISDHLDRVGLVFDTRFATCHRNAKETLEDPVAAHIEHVHISDYRGGLKEFRCLRPVFHPGEGICDFPLIFSHLKSSGFAGSFNLESPGIVSDGPEIDLDNLKRSLKFIKDSMENC